MKFFLRFLKTLALCGGVFLAACAGNRNAVSTDSECADCGNRGNVELEIFDEKGFVEIRPDFWNTLDSGAVLGSFPAQEIVAKCPEGTKICHSFSEDALDFDLAGFEDSLLKIHFPNMQHAQMLEGLWIPDEDSLWLAETLQKLLRQNFADAKSLNDFSPWEERACFPVGYSAFDRPVPESFAETLRQLNKKFNVRYISIPVRLQVEMLPKLGRSGGFYWKSLWTLWDARRGSLAILVYSEFKAKTTGSVPPERFWAKPFAERLEKALSKNPETIENH